MIAELSVDGIMTETNLGRRVKFHNVAELLDQTDYSESKTFLDLVSLLDDLVSC